MAERVHISSAIVLVRPRDQTDVADRLAALPGLEIHAMRDGRIVVVMEAASAAALGEMLNRIVLMDGVQAANMVFEQAMIDDETDTTTTGAPS